MLVGWLVASKVVVVVHGQGTVDGTGPVEGEEEVRWKELRRQAWEGLDWKSRSGWEGRRGLRGQLQVL